MFSYTIYHVLSFKRVSIGVVYSDPYSEEEIMSLIDIAQKDINKYSKSIRRNYIFDFKIVYLPHFYRADINLTKSLKSDGIDLIIGFDYSGQCKEVLSFIKENEMLLLTPYSSSDDLINEGDNLFRLRCVDSYQGLILAKMLKSLGIKAIIILRLNISWGANIADRLVLEFTKNGGVILSYIKYDQIFGNCSSIFNSLENTVQKAMNDYENDEIAIVNIGIFDTVDLIKKIETNSTLSNLYWFGSDAIPSKFLYDLFEEDVPKVFSNVKLFCPSQAPAYSEKYTKVNERYKQKTGKSLDFVQSARHDACWIYALSIIESKTTEVSKIKNVLPYVCSNYEGITGNCLLNQYGDRMLVNYDIYGFFDELGETKLKVCGFYNTTSDEIIWDKDD